MQLEDLKQQAYSLIEACESADTLHTVVDHLSEVCADCAAAPISFDPDGKAYTADQLGELLDGRVDAMRRGEQLLNLEELELSVRSWRVRFK